MKKYLVTGGAGFIGSHLVEKLIQLGHKVSILDNLSNGTLDNLDHINKDFNFYLGSVTDVEDIKTAMHECSGVFHLAAISSVGQCEQDKQLANNVNVQGTFNVLSEANRLDIPSVFVSSAAVYAHSGVSKESNSFLMNDKHSFYSITKLIGEMYAGMISNKTNIVRPFNVYGPRQKDGVIAKFCKAIIQKQAPILHGDGDQVRDFIYVEDVVHGMVRGFNQLSAWRIFNLGTGHVTSINCVCRMVQNIAHTTILAQLDKPRHHDVRCSVADIARAATELGFVARTTLDDGLQKTFEWYKNNMDV